MAAPAVDIQHYSVRYGEFQALQNVSLQVPEESFVAVVGPNGAGKTTLLKAVLGLERGSMRDAPTQIAGSILVFGHPPREVPPGWVGYVPQVKGYDRSFPALAIEVVVSGLRRQWPFWIGRQERIQASVALERVGALHLSNRRLGRLSGGELQRVYLARSIIRQPKLLLLDEPATGVDVVGEADFYSLLESYQRQSRATVMMITHDWEAAQHHASAVLLLNRRVIGYGIPSEVMRQDCLAQAFGHVGHSHGVIMGGR